MKNQSEMTRDERVARVLAMRVAVFGVDEMVGEIAAALAAERARALRAAADEPEMPFHGVREWLRDRAQDEECGR